MSQENVEIVRRGYERFNEADIDGFLELCAPGLEFRDLPELPGSGVFIGHDAVRVLVPTVGTGRGRSSGAPVELHFWNVWTVSDGKLTSCISYGDRAEALAAAGLRE